MFMSNMKYKILKLISNTWSVIRLKTPIFLSHFFTCILFVLSFLLIYLIDILWIYFSIDFIVEYTIPFVFKTYDSLVYPPYKLLEFMVICFSSLLLFIQLKSLRGNYYNLYNYIRIYIFEKIKEDKFIFLLISSFIVTLNFGLPFRLLCSGLDLIYMFPVIAFFSGGLVYLINTCFCAEKPSLIKGLIAMVFCGIFSIIIYMLILHISIFLDENILSNLFITNIFMIIIPNYFWFIINEYFYCLCNKLNMVYIIWCKTNIYFSNSSVDHCSSPKTLPNLFPDSDPIINTGQNIQSSGFPSDSDTVMSGGEDTQGYTSSSNTELNDLCDVPVHPITGQLDSLNLCNNSVTDPVTNEILFSGSTRPLDPFVAKYDIKSSLNNPHNKELYDFSRLTPNDKGQEIIQSNLLRNLINTQDFAVDADWPIFSPKTIIHATELSQSHFENFTDVCSGNVTRRDSSSFYKLSNILHANSDMTDRDKFDILKNIYGLNQMARMRHSINLHGIGIYSDSECFTNEGTLKRTHAAIYEVDGKYVAFPNPIGHSMHRPNNYKDYISICCNLFLVRYQIDDNMIENNIIKDNFIDKIASGELTIKSLFQNGNMLSWNDETKDAVVNKLKSDAENNKKNLILHGNSTRTISLNKGYTLNTHILFVGKDCNNMIKNAFTYGNFCDKWLYDKYLTIFKYLKAPLGNCNPAVCWYALDLLVNKSLDKPSLYGIPRDDVFIPKCVNNFLASSENKQALIDFAGRDIFKDTWVTPFIKPSYSVIKRTDGEKMVVSSSRIMAQLSHQHSSLRDLTNPRQYLPESAIRNMENAKKQARSAEALLKKINEGKNIFNSRDNKWYLFTRGGIKRKD